MTQFLGLISIRSPPAAAMARRAPTAFAGQGDAFNAYAATGRKRSGAERDAYGMITKAAPRAPLSSRAGMCGRQVSADRRRRMATPTLGSNTTTSRIAGVAAGADYWLSPQTVAGFALAGGGTNFNVANGGSGRSDLFQAGAFVRHTVGAAYHHRRARLWLAGHHHRPHRYHCRDRSLARAVQCQCVVGPRRGRLSFCRAVDDGIGITPYAAVQFTTFDLPAYAESVVSGANTFALAYGAKTVTATRSELGLRSRQILWVADAILTLRGRAAWAHDYNTDRAVGRPSRRCRAHPSSSTARAPAQ